MYQNKCPIDIIINQLFWQEKIYFNRVHVLCVYFSICIYMYMQMQYDDFQLYISLGEKIMTFMHGTLQELKVFPPHQ